MEQPRARYKQSLDPTVEDVKKLCDSLRRGAKDERVLFHYNGHGVPRPTSNSEMWVFNKNFTQYIPLSVYDLQVLLLSAATQAERGRTLQKRKSFALRKEGARDASRLG